MVAAISTAINPKRAQTPTPRRTPLLPSESDNALAPPRRPKAREVTSRYMSSSSSSSSSVSSPPRRCQSPLVVTRTVNSTKPKQTPTPTPLAKRSQSAERRRQGTPKPTGTGAPTAQKVLFTSTRSLSVSFQGESFPIQVRTTKPPPSQSFRKSTPERRKAATTPTPIRNGNSDHTENARSLDRHRWPAKSQPPPQQVNCVNRSSEYADSAERKQTDAPANVVRSLQNMMADVRASHDATLRSESYKINGSEFQHEPEPVPSDNESVTSGSSSGEGIRGSRGIVVPARFWQEHNNRLRRQTETPSSRNGVIGNKGTVATHSPRLLVQKKSAFDCPVSSPRGVVNSRVLQGSPIRSAVRPASPSKLATPSVWSPSRGVSPSRAQNGVSGGVNSRFGSEPSVLSFAVDVSRGKVGENRIVDAHLLRLFHNRLLQWRFVNARADAALSAQTLNAEKSLYDAWLAASKLRESVRAKRTEFQLLKQQFKLISILKDQMVYLEDWATLDRVYSSSLSGATEALRASTLRLPVVGGAKTDLLNLKDAICSAMDVMQAMASSICLLSPKVGQLNSLVVEVANLTAKERVLLDECKDLLSVITTLQVRECSLRTHSAQLKCLPRSTTGKITIK